MKFTPKTEREIAELGNLPKGAYPFEVLNAAEKRSKSGNDMIDVELLVYAGDGGTRKLHDYLMEKMARKLSNFCHTQGLEVKYDAGTLIAEDCLGRSGYLFLTVQEARPKEDGSGDWPARNSVADYIDTEEYHRLTGAAPKAPVAAAVPAAAAKPVPAPAKAGGAADNEEDDVPF